jgi:3-oxoacyl-[acyl-carrier protein] reductase
MTLRGRTALVTGVSRRAGIGHAIARRLAGLGANVFAHHLTRHDAAQPWGGDEIDAVLASVRESLTPDGELADLSLDLTADGAPERLVDAAVERFGHLDVLVCNHALSGSDGALGELSAAMLDAHYAVNARATILLAQAFAAAHDDTRPGGRVIMMTSGQGLGPMPGEVAYAASKGALASITVTLADQLADRGITVNTVNPGPVDTGYASPEDVRAVASMFPGGRWGEPDDPARLIAWLATDDARWITGQVINSEGGFRRWGR